MLNELTAVGSQWPPTDTDPGKHLFCFALFWRLPSSVRVSTPSHRLLPVSYKTDTAGVVPR